jgi:hypothetical protein
MLEREKERGEMALREERERSWREKEALKAKGSELNIQVDAAKRELDKVREAFVDVPTAGPPKAFSPSTRPIRGLWGS